MLFDDERRDSALLAKQKQAYVFSNPDALYKSYIALLRQAERLQVSQRPVVGRDFVPRADLDKANRLNKKLKAELDTQKKKYAQLEKHLNNLRQSKTMKAGRIVTWPLNYLKKIKRRIAMWRLGAK